MKMLKKLALVSAVSMISAGAFAMEAMDDESMAGATGQDGISILVSPGTTQRSALVSRGVSTSALDSIGPFSNGTDATAGTADDLYKGLSIQQVVIHDDDGIATNKNSGSLVIGNNTDADSTVVFAKGDMPIQIDLDMVGDTSATPGNQSMLNVKITTPTLAIKTGAMYVSNSNAHADGIDKDGAALVGAEVDGTSQDLGTAIKIANGMEIILGATTINIQLGSESQTLFGGAESATNPSAMILVDATLAGGLTLNNSSLIDAGGTITGGTISMKSLKVTDAGGANLTAKVAVNVEDNILNINPAYTGPAATEGGLIVTLGQLGGVGTGIDVAINNTVLGSSTAQDLGDVQILGLQLAGTNLIIRGH